MPIKEMPRKVPETELILRKERAMRKSRNQMFLNIADYLAAEGAAKPLSGLEKILLRALDDKQFRDVLNKNPDEAVKRAGIELTKVESSRLRSFIEVYDLSDMVDSKKLLDNRDILKNTGEAAVTAGVRG